MLLLNAFKYILLIINNILIINILTECIYCLMQILVGYNIA